MHPSKEGRLFHAKCENMLPAERCVVLIWPNMSERQKWLDQANEWARVPVALMRPLEQHGMDEIECGYESVIEMRPAHDTGGWYLIGDCPRCGQDIKVYDNPGGAD